MEISIIKPELSTIQNVIYEIRGRKIILDYDLAKLYETETKVLKQSVRRNLERFPSDFMFEITREEYNSLRSQFVTLESIGRGKYSKYQPFAFTEQGVAMLSSVLNNKYAVQVNISIMRAFVAIRQYALNYSELNRKLDEYMKHTDMRLDDMCEVLDELINQKREFEKPSNPIGFVTSRIEK